MCCTAVVSWEGDCAGGKERRPDTRLTGTTLLCLIRDGQREEREISGAPLEDLVTQARVLRGDGGVHCEAGSEGEREGGGVGGKTLCGELPGNGG